MYKLKAGKLTQPPCIKGFTQTINGVLQFFEEGKAYNIVFLLTNRLNQDVLENLFSIFRQHGGYNKNPTVRTIRTSIRSNCIFSLYASKGANCEAIQEVEESIILPEDVTQIDKCNSKSDSDTEFDSNLFISSSKNSIESPNQNKVGFTLEDCSVTYFAGYLGYRVIKKIGCNQCKNELLLSDINLNEQNQLLLLNKNYTTVISSEKGLRAPSGVLNSIVNEALNIFEINYKKILHKKKLNFNY